MVSLRRKVLETRMRKSHIFTHLVMQGRSIFSLKVPPVPLSICTHCTLYLHPSYQQGGASIPAEIPRAKPSGCLTPSMLFVSCWPLDMACTLLLYMLVMLI